MRLGSTPAGSVSGRIATPPGSMRQSWEFAEFIG